MRVSKQIRPCDTLHTPLSLSLSLSLPPPPLPHPPSLSVVCVSYSHGRLTKSACMYECLIIFSSAYTSLTVQAERREVHNPPKSVTLKQLTFYIYFVQRLAFWARCLDWFAQTSRKEWQRIYFAYEKNTPPPHLSPSPRLFFLYSC